MTARVTMNVFNTLRESTIADNVRGGLNTLTFEYHDLPHFFCEFCRRLGHRHEDCAQYMQAQNLVQHGYQLPAPLALYPSLHPHEYDDMHPDNEQGLFADDSDSSSTNSSNGSVPSNQSERSIKDHNEAIIPNESENSEGMTLNFNAPPSPPFIVNPHLWDEFGFFTHEPTAPSFIQNLYEIIDEPSHNPSTKRPNPSHYLYSFFPEELPEFDPMELYPPANPDPSAASSSRAPVWPTIDDYRSWMSNVPDPKRRKLFQDLALQHPTILMDIYQAETAALPDSPPVRPDSVPMDIWENLGYEDNTNPTQEEIKTESTQCIPDHKGKRIMENQ
ncbi:hypothetical protein MKX03_003457 [Papaver bracteatum]|nr:hypothetical protein MKX03_003457 [Papaver bracteatum]